MLDASKRKERNKRYYEKRKQQLKEQSDQQIEKHLETHPYDLNFGMKPIKSSFPSFKEWLEENSGKSWSDYVEERESFLNDQPRPMTKEEENAYIRGTSDGCCERCHGEIEIGYEGAKLCQKCRLEMS